jgi:hypothetical protein
MKYSEFGKHELMRAFGIPYIEVKVEKNNNAH